MSTEKISTLNEGEEQVKNAFNVGESNVGESNNIHVNEGDDSTQVETGSSFQTEDNIIGKRRTSVVWNHFKKQKLDGKWNAICNYCGSKLLGESKQGTSHLMAHFRCCKLRTTRDIKQAFLKTEKTGSETIVVGNYVFSQEAARCALVKMIVLHEYPMSMVDHMGFKEFCLALQPLFKGISRNTIRSDIMKTYNEGKENIMKLLSKNQSRVAITTDMWTASNQNRGYMTVTAHFITNS